MAQKSTPVDYVSILRQADIFYDLDNEHLQMIARLCLQTTADKGEIIFEENSPSDELYVVLGGAVEIVVSPFIVEGEQRRGDAEGMVVAIIRRGQTFGEVALVDQGLRSALARSAVKGTQLLVLPRDKLIALCDQYPDLGYRLMRNIAADLAFKIRGTDLMIRERLLWRPRAG